VPNPRRSILVVDDIEINRIILRSMFEQEFDVLEAENGMDALRVIDEHSENIAVILLDIIMPELDGIGVLRELTSQGHMSRIPVVIITGEDDDHTSLIAYDMGVSDMVRKPFHTGVVYRRVMNVIELYSNKRNMELRLDEQKRMLEKQAQRLFSSNQFLIDALSTTVEFRSFESGTHIKRVRLLVRGLLNRAQRDYPITDEEIKIVSSASSMHDIGKVAIPDAVLMKPGALTDEEYEVMKTHPVRGCDILESLNYGHQMDATFFNYCYEICRHHHERWDGTGYPDHLKGDDISFVAQATALADVYDALTSKRVYRNALSHDVAVGMILRGECGPFNPRFLQYMTELDDVLRSGVLLEVEPEDALTHEEGVVFL